jgi:hypothetical protein
MIMQQSGGAQAARLHAPAACRHDPFRQAAENNPETFQAAPQQFVARPAREIERFGYAFEER